jgi:hypothetical protein
MSEFPVTLRITSVNCEFHAFHTMTEQFQVCEWGHYHLARLHRCSEITPGSWDALDNSTCPRTSLQ